MDFENTPSNSCNSSSFSLNEKCKENPAVDDYWTEMNETDVLEIKKEPVSENESEKLIYDNNDLLIGRKIGMIDILNKESNGKIDLNNTDLNIFDYNCQLTQERKQRWLARQDQENLEEIHIKQYQWLAATAVWLNKNEIRTKESIIDKPNEMQKIKLNAKSNDNINYQRSLERKRQLNRERSRRWLAKQSEAKLELLRKKKREYISKRRSQMEENERLVNRELDAKRKAISKLKTEEQINLKIEQITKGNIIEIGNETHVTMMDNTTDEEVSEKNQDITKSKEKLLKIHTEEEKILQRKLRAERRANKRANETEEEKIIRRRLDAERVARRKAFLRANETEEEKNIRKKQWAENMARRRANETDKEKNIRRKTQAERLAKKRAHETEEEKQLRRKLMAERMAKKRAKKLEEKRERKKDHFDLTTKPFLKTESYIGTMSESSEIKMSIIDDYLETEIKPS